LEITLKASELKLITLKERKLEVVLILEEQIQPVLTRMRDKVSRSSIYTAKILLETPMLRYYWKLQDTIGNSNAKKLLELSHLSRPSHPVIVTFVTSVTSVTLTQNGFKII